MFKASIALVLIAFGALAYGWIAGNDAVLFGSIGASALAGLALLTSTMKDRKAAGYPSESLPPERPARERRERTRDADFPPPAGKRRGGRRLEPDEMTRQLDLGSEDDEERFEAEPITGIEPIKPSRRTTGRDRLPAAPEGASWAGLDAGDEEEESDFEAAGYEQEQAAFDTGFPEEPYPDEEDRKPAARSPEGAAAADDFRSRLAAVLGPQAEAPAQPEPAPAPEPRSRRTPARDEPDPAPAPKSRSRRTPARSPEPESAAPAKRGRKKATPVPEEPEAEPESAEQAPESEPEWIRLEDVPRVTRATQPGGGFARPDVPGGITPYRRRRPGVPQEEPAEEPPAPKRRKAPAERTAESRVKPVGAKRSPAAAKPSVTRVTGSPARGKAKQPDPDAPPPRRGRPPKPKP